MSKRQLTSTTLDGDLDPPAKKAKLEKAEDDKTVTEYLYEGSLNAENEYDGLGQLVTVSATEGITKYVGYFKNGDSNGFGILFLNVDCSSMLIGEWKHNQLDGVSMVITEREHISIGRWIKGEQDGHFKEFTMNLFPFEFNEFIHSQILRMKSGEPQDTDIATNYVFSKMKEQFKLRLVFEGEYAQNARNGIGSLYLEDGGGLKGKWNDDTLNDDEATYVYPDGVCMLRGQWILGDMVCAKYVDKTGKERPTEYECDIAMEDSIGKHPKLKEEYESERVYVKTSELESAGNGLFALCHFQKGDVICFYNGIHRTHDVINNREWSENANALTINDEFAVDIPPELASVDAYCATLGHFANHHWARQNCEYQPYWSPRFGDIKCLRAIKDIQPHQEILVDYDYKDEFPDWYRKFAGSK